MKRGNLNISIISTLKQQKRQKKLNAIHHMFLSSRHLKQTLLETNKQHQNRINQTFLNLQSSFDKEFQVSLTKRQELKLLKNINQEQEKIDYVHHLNQNKNQKVWNTFLFKRNKIRNNKLKQLNKIAVLSSEEKQAKIVKLIEDLCQQIFQDTTLKIYEKQSQISQLSQKIRQKYKSSHQFHNTHLQLKSKLGDLQKQTQVFFKQQKQNQKERNQSLMDKRNQKVHKKQYEYLNLNLNDEGVKQIIQKKAKLNLQLDLNFQIQQRKFLNQKKKQFQTKKNNLRTLINEEKSKIQTIKIKINQLQKQQTTYQEEKQAFQEQRKNFLKNLLKYPQYRSDGIIWTIKKMLEINYKPELNDLPEDLDVQSKQYIIKKYNQLKKQFVPSSLQYKHYKKQKKKQKNISNRSRVKSMIIRGNNPSNDFQNFFKFQFKNNFAIEKPLLIKKNTSQGLYQSHANLFGYEQKQKDLDQTLQKQKTNSFKYLTKKKNVKQVYQGTKFYINKWIKQQGWKSLSAKKIQDKEKSIFNKEYIDKQKIRIKQKYHRLGGSNRKYQIMVKTLFGNKQLQTGRKVQTSRN